MKPSSFAQDLERIGEILDMMGDVESFSKAWDHLHKELKYLLDDNAENIVALGKVAGRMRRELIEEKNVCCCPTAQDYDKLMGAINED